MGLAPYIMSSDYLNTGNGELGFSKGTIITSTLTSKQFSDAYTQQVSGIDLSGQQQPGLIT